MHCSLSQRWLNWFLTCDIHTFLPLVSISLGLVLQPLNLNSHRPSQSPKGFESPNKSVAEESCTKLVVWCIIKTRTTTYDWMKKISELISSCDVVMCAGATCWISVFNCQKMQSRIQKVHSYGEAIK